jgi:hypothetical protein
MSIASLVALSSSFDLEKEVRRLHCYSTQGYRDKILWQCTWLEVPCAHQPPRLFLWGRVTWNSREVVHHSLVRNGIHNTGNTGNWLSAYPATQNNALLSSTVPATLTHVYPRQPPSASPTSSCLSQSYSLRLPVLLHT